MQQIQQINKFLRYPASENSSFDYISIETYTHDDISDRGRRRTPEASMHFGKIFN